MKNARKLASLLLALVMILSLATTAFAAEGTATITVKNAAKGETYKIVKLFDASVTGTEDGPIAYTGTIPDALAAYFTQDTAGNITANQDTLSDEAIVAMKAWAETQTATAEKTGEGGEVIFENLEYGYYIVLTAQGAAITVTSTNPDAVVYDKNSKEPNVVKTVAEADTGVAIGDTVTYTVRSVTTNWLGQGENSKQVTKYEITDTLPEFLTGVTVTSIVVDNDGDTTTTDDQIQLTVQQFSEDKKISIDWVDKDGNSLYNNGALLIVTYTAKVTSTAVIDGEGNKNEVTLQPYVKDGETVKPWEKTWKDDEVIKTYAAALKKVDDKGNSLAGATFYVNGLIVEGTAGNYTVVSYNPESTEKGTIMATDAEGNLIIKGLPSDVTLQVYEEAAPAGYNKLTAPVELKPTIINETVTVTETTTYYDAEGNVTETMTGNSKTTIDYNEKLEAAVVKVVNKTGSILPETGGMGTTLFYIIGAALMLGAVVLLVTKKRVSAAD